MIKPAFAAAILFAIARPAFADTPINVTIPLGIKNVGPTFATAVIGCKMSPLTKPSVVADIAAAYAQAAPSTVVTAPLTSGTNENTVLFQILVPKSPVMKSLICELQGFTTGGSSTVVPLSAITLDATKKLQPNIVGEIPNY